MIPDSGLLFGPPCTREKLSRCTRANHLESRAQTEKTTSPVYKRATSFRYCTYVENWLYVCRHGEVVFSVGTRLEVACSDAACQFCKCSVAFFETTCRLQNFDTYSADCRL